MTTLQEQLAAARAEVERLEHLAQSAECSEIGHDWGFIGGANASCSPGCYCSVPVHGCTRCGDCDYGANAEADAKRAACRQRREAE